METKFKEDVIDTVPKFYALSHAKCPKCRKGNMFSNSMYGLKAQKMNENCPYCNFKFEREPGYFYVAMFVSYALNVAQMVTIGVLTYLITKNTVNPWLYMATIFPFVFILAPFNYRYSRVILMYYLTPGLHYVPNMNPDHSKSINRK